MARNYVELKVEESIATLTINRQEALNALNRTVLEELKEVINNIAADDQVKALIITGAGSKSFVAGADIAAMKDMTPLEAKEFSFLGHRVFAAIEKLPIPVIAAINGFALGGGCELALACDIRIAASTARLGQPEVKLGIIPGFGGTQRLARIVGKGIASELIFSGEMIDAERALAIGLVNAVVPPEKLMEEAQKLAQKIIANGPVALRYAKAAIHNGLQMTLEQGCQYEVELFTDCFTTEDQDIGMAAFLSKQKPVFKGV
ncbi:enoyl-CoA hydratase-related protein [Neomoorella carbonis]|uniref:enoyl-CoA hydratase-related protein n=1 Tax=Neomoorella carbonis TaxID=3062783 RepID=UPI0032510637